MTTIQVFHNVAKDAEGRPLGFFGYQPSQALVEVAHVDVGGIEVNGGGLYGALDRVFYLLNVGDDPEFGTPDPQAVAYRARRNRSLSVGDVCVIEGVAFAVASFGFEPVTIDPASVTETSSYGSTALDKEPVA
ncbi:MAG: hypothetical protein NVS3B1_17670 [Marmoricola sp.]